MPKAYLNYIGIYLFNPFLAFLYSINFYERKWFKNALWLFIIFFGFSMSFIETIDAYAYKEVFEGSTNRFRFVNSLVDVFNPTLTGQVDFLQPLLNYVLSGITDNYHVLFGVHGLIFGYFYSRNVDFVLKLTKYHSHIPIAGLVLFFACFIGFWQINGFRFWTASHLFVYGLINFIYLRNINKGVVFMLLSMAVHFSFVLPVIVFFVYKFIPDLKRIFIVGILAVSIYNPLNDLPMVQSYMQTYAYNEQIELKIEAYTSEEAAISDRESSYKSNPFKIAVSIFNKILILTLAWLLIGKLGKEQKLENKFLKYGLILALVGALLSFVPSLGRFLHLALFIILIAIVVSVIKNKYFMNSRKQISGLGYIATFLIIPTNLWILATFSLHTIFGNYATVLFDESDILYSVWDLVILIFR